MDWISHTYTYPHISKLTSIVNFFKCKTIMLYVFNILLK